LFKLAIVAALRVFVPKSGPPLQIASLFSLFLHWLPRPLKTWGVTNMAAPVHYLSASVIGMRVAELIVKWSNPELSRTIRFWQHLLPIYLGYMKTKWLLRNKSMQERDESWAKTHEWGGQKVHNLVLDLSGFYVKSAQILATKADFVPEAWTKHLSSHLDNTPPRPFSEVEYSIRQELLRSPQGPSFPKDKNALVPLGVVFSHVEKIPIAAASIAQVHAGFLKDGTRIVIKVQHLRMETMMGSDLRNLAWVARFLKNQLPVDLEPIVKEIQSTIPLEFDFEREAWFMETIKRNLEKQNFRHIVCPIPYLNLCTKRLIVMQRLDGIRFTQVLCPNASEDLLARIPEMVGSIHSLLQAYGQMLFVDGVFHADPHAGNLLLLLDGRLGLLDYGQCKVLDAETRLKLAKIVLALSDNDDVEIARALLDAEMVFENITGDDISVSDFSTVARILFDVSYVEEATVSPTAQNSILRRTPLKSFNRALWLVVRAIFILRGLCFMLKIDTSAATIWRPYALVALQAKHS